MPSPFPGMDPYLEASEWPSFHTQLIAELGRQLTPKLVPKYLARVGEREVLTITGPEGEEQGEMYPDVAVVARIDGGVAGAASSDRAGAALAAPVQLRTVIGRPAVERVLEIRDAKNRTLVTQIELLSPTNKRGDGYLDYLNKRSLVLRSKTHLLEVDLLAGGRRVPMRDPLPPAPYFVFLSRAAERPYTEVWPVQLDERLPVTPVPLLDADADVVLDLQAAFTNVYDQLGYAYELDYTGPVPVRLTGPATAWVDTLLANVRRGAGGG